MKSDRPYAGVQETLKTAGLRPTRQRLALARLLFADGDCHVTAEWLHNHARRADVRVSLATVYNTLHQFTEAGLLREVVVDSGRSYFDTNTADHHHFYCQDSGELIDIPVQAVSMAKLPSPPDGAEIAGVDVVIRLRHI